MKKLFLFFLGVLPFLVVSCNSDDDKSLEGTFFTIKDVVFKNENLPSGDGTFISNLQINEKAINGGTSIVTFSSSEELSEMYVGIKGLKGYFECPVTSVERAGNLYLYEVTLLLSQYLSETFAVSISGISIDGALNATVNSDDIDVITVATGKLQISLSWDQFDDVDLYLLEPNENIIYYGNKFSSENSLEMLHFYSYLIEKYTDYSTQGLDFENDPEDFATLISYYSQLPYDIDMIKETKEYADKNSGLIGFLDLDSNAGCAIDRINNENITFTSVVKDGTYVVAVDLYEKCSSSQAGARYAVTLNYDGKPVTFSSKQIGKFADSYQGSEGDNPTIIGSFTITNGKIEVTESRNMELRSSKQIDPRMIEMLKQVKK